jgi:hypothetical protein
MSTLSLTRYPGERITIFTSDGSIQIEYSEKKKGSRGIQLNFIGPSHVRIVRNEILTEQELTWLANARSIGGRSQSAPTLQPSSHAPLALFFTKPADDSLAPESSNPDLATIPPKDGTPDVPNLSSPNDPETPLTPEETLLHETIKRNQSSYPMYRSQGGY